LNAHHSWKSALSKNIPALVFVGSDKDQYVHTKHIKKWIHSQRAMAANIQAIQCPQAFHELDNEPQEVGGNLVRALSVQFLKSRALKKTFKPTSLSQICHQI
jgi:alpha-beta hydrolase superfamily lysophospholipase